MIVTCTCSALCNTRNDVHLCRGPGGCGRGPGGSDTELTLPGLSGLLPGNLLVQDMCTSYADDIRLQCKLRLLDYDV